jgi:glutamate synthase domain-containing protein 2
MSWPTVIASGVVAALIGLATYDVIRRRHTILRTFPLIGHLRFLLEAVGPELRQYIVTNNDEERPFSRDQRRWIYTSAKRTSTYFGFGTDKDLELASNYLILDQAAFPLPRPAADDDWLPCAKVVGAARGRSAAFRPASRVNISAMSYGSLSGRAIEAINRGCAAAGCLHNTGEGGLSPYHLHGGDLCSRSAPATSDVGARTAGSAWSAWLSWSLPTRSRQLRSSSARVRSPGWVGVLAAAKVSPEIAAIRGVPVRRDCVSPSAHTAFSDADSLLDVVEDIAQATGLPVGIKSAVGETAFWDNLVRLMRDTGRGVDFVTIDGGEGGTGAAPLAFSNHVALPFKLALSRVYRRFATAGLADDVVFIGSGKLGLPENALLAVALGCDLINVAREAKLAVDCI